MLPAGDGLRSGDAMIIVRSPLRISLGGGSTDLPSYYRRFGGFCLSAAIDKYVYITLHENFNPGIILKYSEMERVSEPSEIKNAIIREALLMVGGNNLEICSMSDIPGGTGLGSSSAFTCALLKALHARQMSPYGRSGLAKEACIIEIEKCGAPIGKQDQYISAFGGIQCFTFNSDDTVQVEPLRISSETRHSLEDNMLLFFTGFTRDASSILIEQVNRSNENLILDNLHRIKELGESIRTSLEQGNLDMFAGLLNAHWAFKKRRSRNISSNQIDDWYELALTNGALGGKLVGAGGGGFLLFYCEDKVRVRKALSMLREVRFHFDFEGTKVLAL